MGTPGGSQSGERGPDSTVGAGGSGKATRMGLRFGRQPDGTGGASRGRREGQEVGSGVPRFRILLPLMGVPALNW